MKNKGRKHLTTNANQKGCLMHITRPIESMSPKGFANGRFDKKKWSKRIRGYFKSQTKNILNSE